MRALANDQRINGVRYGWEGDRNASPSVQRVNGTVVRRNHALNPRHVSGGSTAEAMQRWTWARRYVSNFNGLHGVTTACRTTSPSIETTSNGALGSGRGFDFYANMDTPARTSGEAIASPVIPGETLHLECSFAMSFSGSASLQCRFHDGAGTWVSARISGSPATPSGVGVVTPASMDVVVPAGSAYLSVQFVTAGSIAFLANSTMDMSELYIGAPGNYFDGDSVVTRETINGVKL